MTAKTADFAPDLFSRTPPPPAFARALEALTAIRAQKGVRAAAAWARGADDATRICAIALVLENTRLAVNLLRDLERAQSSRNDRKVAKVRRRLDQVLAAI